MKTGNGKLPETLVWHSSQTNSDTLSRLSQLGQMLGIFKFNFNFIKNVFYKIKIYLYK